MRPFLDDPAYSPYSTQIHPALTSFAGEVCALVGRLFLYVGALALFAILGVHFWRQIPQLVNEQAIAKQDWSVADHSYQAFAVGVIDHADKSIAYTVLRHPEGGRKDILVWPAAADRPGAELEVYQLGDEAASAPVPSEDLALRMPPGGDLEAAGVVDSKFGTVALLWRTVSGPAKGGPKGCLGFFKGIADPAIRISGWTCQGDSLPAQRSAVACLLDRLTLLTAGNEPELAELFARAELERRNCGAGAAATAGGDWVTQAGNPRLRGPL